MENGYAICFNEWALDKRIKNELGLLLIISSLCAEKGYCFASNKYLADLFNITEVSVSQKIKKLEELGYITIEYKKRGCEVISRNIRLKNILNDDSKNFYSTIKKNFKDNNIIYNNTSNNNKEENIKEEKHCYGKYKRVRLSDSEYQKLINEYGEEVIKRQIELLDEYVESNNNKNKYTNFNLVLRKSLRDNWFKNKQEKIVPSWFDKEISKTEISEEDEEEMKQLLNSF